jgi:hypothetical protein
VLVFSCAFFSTKKIIAHFGEWIWFWVDWGLGQPNKKLKNFKREETSRLRDLKSEWRLSGEGGEDVSLDTVHRQALEEEVDRGQVGAV